MNESDRICRLAELGFKIAQPKGYKPHAVERLFRESVKAITELRVTDLSKCDYRATVSGRIQKALDRMAEDQAFVPERMGLDAKADEFAGFFVDEILNKICDGKPGRLKKMANNLADGYYSATLSIRRKYWDERNLKAMSKSEREEMI
jgi:CRISPR-associated protein Csc3